MRRTEWLQETRRMRFEEAYEGWKRGSLTQVEAALLLGVCDWTFRCYVNQYDEGGLDADSSCGVCHPSQDDGAGIGRSVVSVSYDGRGFKASGANL